LKQALVGVQHITCREAFDFCQGVDRAGQGTLKRTVLKLFDDCEILGAGYVA
jgi:hypothetical protein